MRSFGRVQSRALKKQAAERMLSLRPRFDLAPALVAGSPPLALGALFPLAASHAKTHFALEIGFGGGEHLVGQALAHPDWGLIGCEPFVNGLAQCLGHIEAAACPNIRLYGGDVRDIMPVLPDGSLTQIWMLFPDPWPKTRHRKRRLLQPALVSEIARILEPGGRFSFATDWRDYAREALYALCQSRELHWTAQSCRDWLQPPEGHISTRYENKALGDTTPLWFHFERDGSDCTKTSTARPA